MNGGHDILTMDKGMAGWKVKTRAAEVLVRHRRPDLPRDARITIGEIVSNQVADEVQVHFSAKTGFFIWAKDLGEGTVRVGISEFNSFMNRYC
jgi:hypothetical protein